MWRWFEHFALFPDLVYYNSNRNLNKELEGRPIRWIGRGRRGGGGVDRGWRWNLSSRIPRGIKTQTNPAPTIQTYVRNMNTMEYQHNRFMLIQTYRTCRPHAKLNNFKKAIKLSLSFLSRSHDNTQTNRGDTQSAESSAPDLPD